MKPLVIYHDNCADGFGAAFAAWWKLREEADYLPMQYGKLPGDEAFEAMVREREVFILDFSLPKPMMEVLFALAHRVVWLDHHASVMKEWNVPIDKVNTGPHMGVFGGHTVVLDNSKSGAMLAWEYFVGDVPLLIKHIDDYDRWVFRLPSTKAINKALWSYTPWSFEQWRNEFLYGDNASWHDTHSRLIEEGEAILRAHKQNVTAVVKGAARPCKMPNYSVDPAIIKAHQEAWELRYEQAHVEMAVLYALKGLAANCPPHLSSDVGHELATQSGTYGLLWHVNKDGKCICSLRSNGDYDVSAIAKTFGGGGHRNAAGFEVDIHTLLEWIK